MLLILSTGYSGTKFASEVFGYPHEPRKEDYKDFWYYVYGLKDSTEYVKRQLTGTEREVNSNLLPHLNAIEKEFDDVNVIHLVRNPKDTIRSFMSGTIFSTKDQRKGCVKLTDENSRFEACVDWWVKWHTRLDPYPLIRLEDLRGTPVNAKEKTFPQYFQWTDAQKEYFTKTDELAKKYGYI